MKIIERVNAICEERLDSLAKQIKSEMVNACLQHKKTGAAANSVFIEKTSEKTRFIGSKERSFYYLDQGNGGRNTVITPKHSKMLHFVGYKTPYTGKEYFLPSVHGYDGIHFVQKIADRHR